MAASEILLRHLKQLEPDTDFKLELPRAISSKGNIYFVKLGSPTETEQYRGEVDSLNAINAAAPGLAPKVFTHTILPESNSPLFISEYKDLSALSNAASEKLATRLAAELHTYKSSKGFGFDVPTYCGVTRLKNGWFDSWEACYDSMISELLSALKSNRGNEVLCERGQEIREIVIPFLLKSLNIEPVLLHGDLWSGNAGTDRSTEEPIIFDPSSFYGHNEADLAIARIFGGFPESFYRIYHEKLPKAEPIDQYELRIDLYELFHYLNHTLIFGGNGYRSSALKKMDRLLRYCH